MKARIESLLDAVWRKRKELIESDEHGTAAGDLALGGGSSLRSESAPRARKSPIRTPQTQKATVS
jgi:hypothetical protein